MSTNTESLAILFADISGSTSLYERLGDERARGTVAEVVGLLARATRDHQGTVVKTIGDAIMATFATVAAAVRAGLAMHTGMAELARRGRLEGGALGVKIGLHFGPVLIEQGDVFGDAVNVAARLVELAKREQILTTEQALSLLDGSVAVRTRFVDCTLVKGRKELLNLYEVLSEQVGTETAFLATVPMPVIRTLPRTAFLRLRFREQSLLVDEGNPSITIGRAVHNDLIVNHSAVSRRHGRVDLRRGKFVLVDQSTNGTYVFSESSDPIYVHRDEHVLAGSGIFGLGAAVGPDSDLAVRYVCEEG